MQIQKVAIIQVHVALLYLAITTIKAAGHVTARNALHVAPVGGVDLIEHKAEAANQRIPRADAAGCVPRMGVMCSSLFTLKARRSSAVWR